MKEKHSRKITQSDVSLAVFSGIACLALLFKLQVWAIFFGWGWYTSVGGGKSAFKKILPAMLLGYTMAGLSVLCGELFAGDGFVLSIVISVALTVLLMTFITKFEPFAHMGIALNAYSCMFAAYYAGAYYPAIANGGFFNIINILICMGIIAFANIIGLFIGVLNDFFGKTKFFKKVS